LYITSSEAVDFQEEEDLPEMKKLLALNKPEMGYLIIAFIFGFIGFGNIPVLSLLVSELLEV